jgi:cobaltochelatase CobS
MNNIVKMSKRTIRQECETCGSKELYWGKRGSDWVLINANPTTLKIRYKGNVPERWLHEHQPKPKAEEQEQESPASETPDPYDPYWDPYWEPSIARGGSSKPKRRKVTETTVAEVEAELKSDPWAIAEPEIKVPEPSGSHSAEMEGLLEMLRNLLGQPKIDKAEVENIAREVIKDVVFPTKTVVVDPKGKALKEIEGYTHVMTEKVIRAARTRHVFLAGPAGTGKSTIAEKVSEALDLPFYSISLTQQTPEIALRGYTDANGKYHRTSFLDAFEKGGVFCVDEIDHGHPNTVGIMNAALSNGSMYFPGYNNNKNVKRHKDFRVIATANTYGRGASREYVGATQLDAASIDRFRFLAIDVDEALEAAMVGATGVDGATQKRILEYVKQLRRNREATGARVVISPRASVGIATALLDGFTFDEAVDMDIRKGASDDVWSKLTA